MGEHKLINKNKALTQEQAFNLYNFYTMLYYSKNKNFDGKDKLKLLGYESQTYITAEEFIIREELIDYYNKNIDSCTNRNFFSKVVDWADRQKTKNFLDQLKKSERFESEVANFFLDNYSINIGFFNGKEQYKGETKVGIEIKNDQMSEKTGNYAIECYEKSNPNNPNWINSGILKEDNTVYFFMGYVSNNILQYKIFKKSTLLKIWKHRDFYIKANKIKEYKEKQHGTSKGYLILKGSTNEFEESIQTLVSYIKDNHPDSVVSN